MFFGLFLKSYKQSTWHTFNTNLNIERKQVSIHTDLTASNNYTHMQITGIRKLTLINHWGCKITTLRNERKGVMHNPIFGQFTPKLSNTVFSTLLQNHLRRWIMVIQSKRLQEPWVTCCTCFISNIQNADVWFLHSFLAKNSKTPKKTASKSSSMVSYATSVILDGAIKTEKKEDGPLVKAVKWPERCILLLPPVFILWRSSTITSEIYLTDNALPCLVGP